MLRARGSRTAWASAGFRASTSGGSSVMPGHRLPLAHLARLERLAEDFFLQSPEDSIRQEVLHQEIAVFVEKRPLVGRHQSGETGPAPRGKVCRQLDPLLVEAPAVECLAAQQGVLARGLVCSGKAKNPERGFQIGQRRHAAPQRTVSERQYLVRIAGRFSIFRKGPARICPTSCEITAAFSLWRQ